MANSEHPDQDCYSGSSLIWVCTVFSDKSDDKDRQRKFQATSSLIHIIMLTGLCNLDPQIFIKFVAK